MTVGLQLIFNFVRVVGWACGRITNARH